MNNFILISISMLMLASCHNDHQLTATQKTAIVHEVKETINKYYGDVKQIGLLAEFNYLDSTEDFFWVPPAYDRWLYFDTVAAILRRNAHAYDSVINTVDTIHVIALHRNLATYTARISSRMVDTTGHSSVFNLMETAVVIRRKDGWKLLQGQTSIITQ